MTTEKTIRRIYTTIQRYSHINVTNATDTDYENMFAPIFYPRLFKKNKEKAIAKTILDITVCSELEYISVDDTATTLGDYITLTPQGAKRIESKSDSLKNFFLRMLIALGGVAGTVLCSLLIQLIQTYI